MKKSFCVGKEKRRRKEEREKKRKEKKERGQERKGSGTSLVYPLFLFLNQERRRKSLGS